MKFNAHILMRGSHLTIYRQRIFSCGLSLWQN